MRKKCYIIILFLLFWAVLIPAVLRISYVLREKEGTNIQDNFKQLERDSVDVVFIGSSHQFCTINPDLLYEEYGINSFMLATSAQTIPMSYYAAMEAIELQHPKAIVLEALYCTNDFRTVTPEMSHTFFDGMPRCEAGKLAIEDLIEPEEQIYYYLNLGRYHTRWKDLTEKDFMSNLDSPRGGFYSEETKYNWQIPVISKDEKEPMPEEMLKYLDMLVELCKENKVELIMYVAPFNSLYDEENTREDLFRRQRIFNWLEDYTEEKGLRYYNLFYEIPEMNLDGMTDYKDSQHFNCYGQAKVTRYMVEKGYLSISEENQE
ncbi:MAG: hypothetical protein IKL22_02380 [Lachnospiraceae bacterium]|nr:hypothetical protein [Lachnospiraceae bacterium]